MGLLDAIGIPSKQERQQTQRRHRVNLMADRAHENPLVAAESYRKYQALMDTPLPDNEDGTPAGKEAPADRWKRSAESLLQSQNPQYRSTGLQMISQYHANRTNNADKSRSGTTLKQDFDAMVADGSWNVDELGGFKEFTEFWANRKRPGAGATGRNGVTLTRFLRGRTLTDELYRKWAGDSISTSEQSWQSLQDLLATDPTGTEVQQWNLAHKNNKTIDDGGAIIDWSGRQAGPWVEMTPHQRRDQMKRFREVMGQEDGNFASSFEGDMEKLDVHLETINGTKERLSEVMGFTDWKTTGWAGLANFIPSTDTAHMKDLIATLNSRNALGELESMRAQAQSGASGMGALAVKELDVIMGKMGTLNQNSKPEYMRATLTKIFEDLHKVEKKIKRSQQMGYDRYYDLEGIHKSVMGTRVVDKYHRRFQPGYRQESEAPSPGLTEIDPPEVAPKGAIPDRFYEDSEGVTRWKHDNSRVNYE